jgi:predicted nucleic acid-binding protein
MATAASKISLEHKIPMADSIISATAKKFEAIIWTQDSDFKNIDDVKYFSKK